jgi:hypothetical protein
MKENGWNYLSPAIFVYKKAGEKKINYYCPIRLKK